ncbi:hypothetical protein C8R46DRAFT_1206908 [Mycena filopes]|nr:hypothetical protein C8R46DRAFT_1206908 [Mycena filopes]
MSSRQSSQSASTALAPFVSPMGFVVCMPFMLLAAPMASQLPFSFAPAAPAASPPPQAPPRVTTPPPAPAPRAPGAGLPAALVALLRDGDGPFLANEVFSVAPSQSLEAVEEEIPADEWYAITRGRFVGVVDQYALSDVAITGVSQTVRKAYTTQSLALKAFNQALTWGGVQVV